MLLSGEVALLIDLITARMSHGSAPLFVTDGLKVVGPKRLTTFVLGASKGTPRSAIAGTSMLKLFTLYLLEVPGIVVLAKMSKARPKIPVSGASS